MPRIRLGRYVLRRKKTDTMIRNDRQRKQCGIVASEQNEQW